MDDSNSASKPTASEQLSPDEAFAVLGNETRVGILQVLWDAFESGRGGNAVPYSELFAAVDIADSGNFSYHLEKLTGPFVRRTEDGYELKQTGINVVRAVIAGTVTQDPEFGPVRVDVACPLCETPVVLAYADELMIVSCTACEGRSRWNDESGHLFGAFVPPVGIYHDRIEEAFRVAITYCLHEVAAFHAGVCPDCSSRPETIVDACASHDAEADALCANCGRYHLAEARMVCSTCKRSIPPPVSLVVLNHPDVTSFYHEHGVEHHFATWETVARSFEVGEELVSEEPLRLRFTIPAGADEIQVTLNDDLNVVDVTT